MDTQPETTETVHPQPAVDTPATAEDSQPGDEHEPQERGKNDTGEEVPVPFPGHEVEAVAVIVSQEEVSMAMNEAEEETQRIGSPTGSQVSQQSGPLSCNICEQQFGRQSHLTRHIEACHGERGSQKCTLCTATFNRKDSLSRHMTTQHGENPRRFKCTVVGCDKDFNRKDHLNKHMRGVHKVEPVSSPFKLGADDENSMNSENEDDDEDDGDTPMIMEVSSLVAPSASDTEKKFKCSNHGCGAEYSSMDHLHRHLSRGHTSEMQLPSWGHSIFGNGELKFEVNEGDSTLCMFCCSTYQHNQEIEKQRKLVLASDPHFSKFCEAALRQQRKRMSANTIIRSLNSLKKLSVCQRCFNKIGYAMGTKVAADEVEARVAELRRQLDAELKNLQSEVDQFYTEMKMIEDMIRSSDMSSLEGYLAGIESPEEKEQSSVVLLLRDGIFAVMNDVELYCKRIKGQQIVVNTPYIPKRAVGTPASSKESKRGKIRRKKKLKHKSKGSINPLLHVKVECGPGGEDSENPQTDQENDVDVSVVDKSLTLNTSIVDTPRRQPVREARVKTEEFLKSLFEKQKANDAEELEAVIKTEVLSDTEAPAEDGEALPPTDDSAVEKTNENVSGDKIEQGNESKSGDKEATLSSGKSEAIAGGAEKGELSGSDGKGNEIKDVGKDGEQVSSTEPPEIEEILIEGDEFEDLFDGDTSDEDFNLDITQDDLDSRSESSESESEDASDGPSSENEEEPKPKRPRGRAPRRSKKMDYDPFNFKRSKQSKSSKTKSNNKLAQLHNIDMSGMSDFRKRLLCRILKKNSKPGPKSVPPVPDEDPLATGAERDPRVNFRFEYNKDQGSLFLGDVAVIIHDEHSSLQCSKCGYLSSPAEKPRRSVPRIMYNHILGKHLYAFQCPQCSATLGSYRRYLDHIKGHQMGFMCDVCGKPLFSEEALRRHRWGHMNAEEMAEAVRQGIKDPRRKHDPTLTFQCTTCGKVFSKKMLLRQHEKTHVENRERIVCTLCGKTFLPSGFISHQKYSCFPEGLAPLRVQCTLCPSTFKSVVLRARHMKYAHSTASIEKPYKCHICGKGFAANEHLQKHIKRHSDARPYLCRKGCGANYKTRKDCTRHEKKCEGSGTPMMRHKGRNDQLNPAPKQEPVEQQQVPVPVIVQTHHQPPPPPIVIQQQAPPQQQQFNVYNIL